MDFDGFYTIVGAFIILLFILANVHGVPYAEAVLAPIGIVASGIGYGFSSFSKGAAGAVQGIFILGAIGLIAYYLLSRVGIDSMIALAFFLFFILLLV